MGTRVGLSHTLLASSSSFPVRGRRSESPSPSPFPQPLCPSSKELAPAIDWLSCLQATFTPMSLSSSQLVVVHDLDFLKHMSRLVEDQLQNHRFARTDGAGAAQGGKGLRPQRSQHRGWPVRASQEDGRDPRT